MSKFVKVMFGTTSGAKSDFNYKLNEINIANNWNPKATNGKDFGGFNYCSEECILRWLHRGDTIYDIEIPNDAENIRLDGATTIFRTNKIIISNPRKVNDELALHFYKISKIPEKSYYKALGVVSIMNYKQTGYAIIKDKINKDNIDEVLEEWNDFISHGVKNDRKNLNGLVKEVNDYLYEIKSDLLVSRFIDKEPFIKQLTSDKVINITGESGSGKSYLSNKYKNDNNYIVIDTDVVFSDKTSDNNENIELRTLFNDKPKDYLFSNFEDFYNITLTYFKNSEKIIVIDSAQYRNIKNYTILKGKIIVMRTSVNTCYERVLNRWKNIKKEYTKEEFQKYKERKKDMFKWYHSLNTFLENIDKM